MLDWLYQLFSIQGLSWMIVALPFIGAGLNGFIALATNKREIGAYRPLVSFIGVILPTLSFVATIIIFITMLGFQEGDPSYITGPLFQWAATPSLVIDVGLKIDQLSILMALMVSGVGSLIHIYSIGYMQHDEGYARYFAELNLFLFFMLILVLADNLVLMFIGWEGVGLCSYLLIGYWFTDDAKAYAATKAFIINRIGDVFFLAGLFLIYLVMKSAGAPIEAGLFNFAVMNDYQAYFLPLATAISLLLFGGAIAKSAQIPLYVWLPDAMVGPTPVSALIHAATMVTAGVYLVVRLNFIFTLSPYALHIVAIIGAVTAIFAATMALTETDLKKILAYSTISQLGYMFLAAGLAAFSAAMFHLLMHSFFKALLFLGAGSVLKAAGTSDIRKLGGLRYRMPLTCWTFVIAAAAMSGLAPFAGFFSKDAIAWQVYEKGEYLLWTLSFLTAGLTAFYIFRAVGLVFFGDTNLPMERFKKVHESSTSMIMPLTILALLTTFGGFIGVPETLGGSNLIWQWLSGIMAYGVTPTISEPTLATETILMVITLLWSIHFSVLGWVIYSQKRDWPQTMIRRLSLAHRLIANKYYIDELYSSLFTKPLVWISKNILWKGVDDIYIDGLAIHGTARSFGFMSAVLGFVQNGKVQQYLLYFLIGAVVVVGYLAL
ncbi:MAG: NADH-quinone oxidoreductase subunit L [Pseudomonadota bacterium]